MSKNVSKKDDVIAGLKTRLAAQEDVAKTNVRYAREAEREAETAHKRAADEVTRRVRAEDAARRAQDDAARLAEQNANLFAKVITTPPPVEEQIETETTEAATNYAAAVAHRRKLQRQLAQLQRDLETAVSEEAEDLRVLQACAKL